MSKVVLIVFYLGSGSATTTGISFNSMSACQAAVTWLRNTDRIPQSNLAAFCIDDSTQEHGK